MNKDEQMKPLAIRVHNRAENDAAVEYFKSQGYVVSENYKHYPYKTGVDKYVCITDRKDIINSTGPYAELDCNIISLPIKEKQVLKVGDLVGVMDGSWNICINNGVVMKMIGNNTKLYTWKVISVGEYVWPINGIIYSNMPEYSKYKTNDIVLVDVNNPAVILITNSDFVRPKVDEIKIGGEVVKFNPDGSLKVGCTTVDKDTIHKIINKVQLLSSSNKVPILHHKPI